MPEVNVCPECAVPEQVSANRTWLNNGDMVQTGNESHRACFIETESLDPIYSSISKTIGMPIGRLVIELASKGAGRYIRAITPSAIREMVREGTLPAENAAEVMFNVAQISGYGKHEIMEMRYRGDRDDFLMCRVTNPYSLFLVCGAVVGGFEAATERSVVSEYREVAPDQYEIQLLMGEHEKILEERLEIREYRHKDGDMELERCPTCGVPKALGEYQWDFDRGIIESTRTGRRMALVGPYVLDPMFKELEAELGKNVVEMAVEAQRLFVKSGAYSVDEVSNEEDFRTQLALRGSGNLRRIESNQKGLQMNIDNVANYMLTIGMAQAFFEMAYGEGSKVEWELSEEGNLEVLVTPRK